jgi:PEP-CTERM motif
MRKLLFGFAMFLAVLSVSHRGLADSLFSFSYNAMPFEAGGDIAEGSGTFTASQYGFQLYTITSITGSLSYSTYGQPTETVDITGLLPTGTLGSDNIFSSHGATPNFTLEGVVFSLSNGDTERFYSGDLGPTGDDESGFFAAEMGGHSGLYVSNTFQLYLDQFNVTDITPAAVPEPSTIALLSTGLLGAVGAFGRKIFKGQHPKK